MTCDKRSQRGGECWQTIDCPEVLAIYLIKFLEKSRLSFKLSNLSLGFSQAGTGALSLSILFPAFSNQILPQDIPN